MGCVAKHSEGVAPGASEWGGGKSCESGAVRDRRHTHTREREREAKRGTAKDMASKCPKCEKTVYFAEKVTSLGRDWHKFCLKCERCNKILSPGSHASHDDKPYCHKPCYATLFGPKGVNIGGFGSYVYDQPPPASNNPPPSMAPENQAPKAVAPKTTAPPKGPSKASSMTTFAGEPNMCPRCGKKVYFAEKVTSLGKDWHRPCLRCVRCNKTLNPGGHAEHDGQPYCHKPCYGILFGPKGVNTGVVGSYIYEKSDAAGGQ